MKYKEDKPVDELTGEAAKH